MKQKKDIILTCPQCKSEMDKVKFEVGYGIEVESLHCKKCGHNVTSEKNFKTAIDSLRHNMQKEVKLIRVGEGIGLRLPNEIVKGYNLKKGTEILLKPESDGIKIVTV